MKFKKTIKSLLKSIRGSLSTEQVILLIAGLFLAGVVLLIYLLIKVWGIDIVAFLKGIFGGPR